MDTPSAASPCSVNSVLPRWFGLLLLLPAALPAQLTTGVVEGALRTSDGHLAAGASIPVVGGTGIHFAVRTDSTGAFSMALPYGRYRLAGEPIFVSPLQTTLVELVRNASGAIHIVGIARSRTAGIWTDDPTGHRYPEAFSLPGLLLSREPTSVTEPLDFTGTGDNRLAVVSPRAFSWTSTQYRLNGMDATDSYQPGHTLLFPALEAVAELVVRDGFAPAPSISESETAIFLAETPPSWHGALSSSDTGAALSSSHLPAAPDRGLVEQPDRFHWLTRDHLDIGGPLTKWADIYAAGAGQWASQTEPLASPGTSQRSRLLFGNIRGRVRAGAADRLDALYSGSRIDLADGGIPAGIEALTANRLAPSFVLPGGFPGESEVDHLDFVQLGWTHLFPAASRLGILELRYGYSTAHLDTGTQSAGESTVELLGGAISGAPPLANLAVRPHHEIDAVWQPAVVHTKGTRQRIDVGGGWKLSSPRNRFLTPSAKNLVTADGDPAFVTEFNTPLDSRSLVRSASLYASDHFTVTPSLSLDLGALADFSRGSLPAQSSPAGPFAPERTLGPRPDLIAWNSVAPRAGFAWQVPHSHGLILAGAYSRTYRPLAGRDLDFANPNSLAGSVYRWTSNAPGPLLLRFGGPYSSISPTLARPYADEIDIGAELALTRRTLARIRLYRRDEKRRIAVIDTGVPAGSFTPVSILDPGPDGLPGTFDDQQLTVYAQNPATFGQDQYLLTNPPGLRELYVGMVAEAGTAWRELTLHASFVAEKSYGPTNPGDAYYENDPGVTGGLFLDPNASIHVAGRDYTDRAFVGKLQALYRLPPAWGRIELATVADYTDGLVFARRLLVTGLPQGPVMVATTVRGSPEGGNRSQYALNWNLRIGRQFQLPAGRLALSADFLNVTNAAQRLQENDISGPSFNLRLPVSLQPPRSVRLSFRYQF